MSEEVKPPVEAPAKPAEPVAPVTPPAEPVVPAAPISPAEPKLAEPPKVEAPAEPKPEEKKEEAPAPKPDEKPTEVKYDLKLKEGSFLNAKIVEDVAAKAKALSLTQEQAQALLDEKDEARVSFAKQQNEALKAKATQWVEDVKNDSELGGDNVNENVESAKRFIQRFASDALKKTLDETGLGNNPELIRLCSRAAKAMAEDKTVFPGSKGAPAEQKPMEDVFYGGSKEKTK